MVAMLFFRIFIIFLLSMLLGVVGIEFSGYSQKYWGSLVDKGGELSLEINELEQAANNSSNERYPLDLRSTNYDSLSRQYSKIEKDIERFAKIRKFTRKIGDTSFYIVLPYTIFSISFLACVGLRRQHRISPRGYGFGAASLMCIAAFFYLLIRPIRCIDIECIVTVVGIPILLITLGALIVFVVANYFRKKQ